MRRAAGVVATIVVALLVQSSATFAKEPQYVGAKKCKLCHNKKAEVKQYDLWKDSQHAQAYLTLGTDEAKKLAIKAGIKTDPQESKECLECHVTGFGLDSSAYKKSYILEDGVQCEACHGPGSKYASTKIMSKTKYADQRETQHELALEAGLVIPDEETCTTCHNERSPAFKGFDFETYYEKIKHEYDSE